MKDKSVPAYYTIDFRPRCRSTNAASAWNATSSRRRETSLPDRTAGHHRGNDQFTVERSFRFALYPIQLKGCLDPHEKGGTWVHGTITQDTENQVLIEGLIVFALFFLVTALFYLRLRSRGFMISVPLLLLTLYMMSLRWRALRTTTEDLARCRCCPCI
jgi:hypothetical protein